MTKKIELNLTNEEYLVLFDFLASRFDKEPMEFYEPDFAEKVALNNLLAALEPILAEPFLPNYKELVDAAKAKITLGLDESAFN